MSSSFVPPSCILLLVAALTAEITEDRMALSNRQRILSCEDHTTRLIIEFSYIHVHTLFPIHPSQQWLSHLASKLDP